MPRRVSERFWSTYLLKLFLMSLTIAFIYGDPRMMTTVFQAVNFAKEIRGWRLNGSVIREIKVDSESSCRRHCVKESSCVSYNFGSTMNNKNFKCQRSDSDRLILWEINICSIQRMFSIIYIVVEFLNFMGNSPYACFIGKFITTGEYFIFEAI